MGISGSQGPKTKIVKRIQGVTESGRGGVRSWTVGRRVGNRILCVDMQMPALVAVDVFMNRSVLVGVNVRMRRIADRLQHAPDKVGDPEAEQQPTGEFAASAFEVFQAEQDHAAGDPQGTEQHGTADMPQAAEQRNQQRLPQRPPADASHRHKGNIVVGAEKRVEKANCGGRSE